jgi:beta-glucosidase
MTFVPLTWILLASLPFASLSFAQIPDNLPIDDATRQYLESLSPEKLAAILKIYQEGVVGQVPASAEVIEAQELYWSYNRSPPFYPTR